MVTLNPFKIHEDMKKAKEDFEGAESIISLADASLYDVKEKARKSLRKLGKEKLKCFSETIPTLVRLLQRIDYTPGCEFKLNNTSAKMPAIQTSPAFDAQCSMAAALATSAASGTVGGGITAYAIYYGVGQLAAASTGTAIAELSGIAAHNAVLAWLGGGSLASGGAGIQGGLKFLGIAGLVVGAGIMTIQLSAKAEKARAEAETQVIKAWEHHDIQRLAAQKLDQLSRLAKLAFSILRRIDTMAQDDIDVLSSSLTMTNSNFEDLSQHVQYACYRGAVYIDLLNAFSQIKIMTEESELVDKAESDFQKISSDMEEKLQ